MDKIGLNAELPIHSWICRGFAGVLHESALEKIWDKVIGGSMVVLVYVATALVETSKMALLGCQTPKEAIRCLVSVIEIKQILQIDINLLCFQTSEETDELIVQKSIELWAQEGSHLLPGGITADNKHHRSISATLSNASAKIQPTEEKFHMASEIRIAET